MLDYEFTILRDKSVIVLDLTGTITLSVLVEAAEKIYSHPDYDADFDTIIDQRHANFEISFSELLVYVDRMIKDARRLRGDTVFVAEKPVNYGMARMYENMEADDIPDSIFYAKTVDEAFEILRDRKK